jgi:RNA 3'-terminal phosphate cyclase (ATP)
MIEIDGDEGGGQFLRSALSLSALTGEPFQITDIRGGRSNPGLRHQHLATVELLAEICDAEVSEAEIGTESLTFRPGAVRPGRYTVDIGTAGSIMLLFDAVLPLAVRAPKPFVLTARGGTDVKWAPTAAHYRQVKIRLLYRFGLQAIVEIDRPGFYPVGGGEATLRIGSTRLSPVVLPARDASADGDTVGARVFSLSSADLAENAVATRQADAAVEGLKKADIPTIERTVRYADAHSPGSSIAIRLDREDAFAGFDAVGEPGKPAEEVAAEAVTDATAFVRDTAAAVDRHTADQLLVFLALAGGKIAVPEITDHIASSRELLSAFGLAVDIERDDGTPVLTADGRSEPRES